MTQNWLFTGGSTANGDQNGVNAVFFEIPDTTTQTLYFAIRNPDVDTIGTTSGNPDRWASGASPNLVTYTLIGGTGAYSSAAGKHLTPAEAISGGTVLGSKDATTYSGVFADSTWVYFNGVSPSQGEHIGNKYYFRLSAISPQFGTNSFKHSYQFDVSLSNSGSPTGLSSGYAFSYDVTFTQLYTNPPGVTETWDFYPFVPYGAASSLTVTTGSFNYAGTNNQILVNSWTDNLGVAQSAISVGANYATTPSISIASSQTNATWHLNFTVQSNFAYTAGGGELYFTSGGTLLPIYTTSYSAPAPDHFVLSPSSSSGLTGSSLSYRAQLVDSGGNPISYIGTAKVTATAVSGNQSLSGLTAPPNITTDATGGANFTVSDTTAETVTLSLTSDGTGGTTNLPGINGSATATFLASPLPTMSSASSLIITQGVAANQPVITISANGGTWLNTATNLFVAIPSSLIANFSTTPPDAQLTAGTGIVGSPTVSGNTVTIPVSGLGPTSVVTVGSTTPISYNATNSASSGFLQLSFDVANSPPVSDSQLVIIQAPYYTWNGSVSTAWNNGSNWTPNIAGGPPTTADVRISTAPRYPVVTATTGNSNGSTITTNNLIIDSGTSLTLNGATAITVSGSFSNSGTFTLIGNEAVNLTNSTATGTVVYAGSGSYTGLAAGSSYYNLTINSGTYTLNSGITVNGNITIAGGTLSAGSQTISLYGNWTRSSGTFTAGSSTLQLLGTGTSVITGAVAPNGFNAFTSTAAGKTIQFATGTTQTLGVLTIAGSPSSNIVLRGTSAATWTINVTSSSVSYADIAYSTVSPGQTASYSTNSLFPATPTTTNSGWTFQSFTSWTGGAGTTSWNTAGNWSPAGVPINTTNVTINPAATQPVLTGAESFASLTIAPGATLDLGGNTVTRNTVGTITVNGTLKMVGNETLTSVSNITGTGTVDLYGTGSYPAVPNFSYYALTISGSGTFNLGAALTVASNLNVSSGTLNAGVNNITVGGNINFTGIIAFSGSGLVTMNPSSAATLRSGGKAFPALTVSSGSVSLGVPLTLTGNLSISSGAAFSSSGLNLTVGGSFANSGTATFSSGTVTFNAASGTKTISGTSVTTFPNLAVSVSGGATLQLTQGVAIAASSSLTIASGAIFDLSGNSLSFGAGDSFTNSGTFRLQGGETITNRPAGTIGGTVIYNGTGNYSVTPGVLVAGNSYTNLTFSGAGGSWALGAALTVNGTLSLAAGSFAAGAISVTVGGGINLTGGAMSSSGTVSDAGNFTRTSGAFTSTGTLTFNSSAAAQSFNPTGSSFANVTISNTFVTTPTVTLTGALSIGGNLAISNGQLDVAAANYQVSVGGNWTNSVGATGFNARSGTVLFSGTGTQTVTSGSASFSTVSMSKTAGALNFFDALTAATLSMGANTSFALAFNTRSGSGGESSTVTNAATLTNSGSLSFGNEAADSIQFSAGLTARGASSITVGGTLQSGTNSPITLQSDAISITQPVNVGTGTVYLLPNTAGTAVSIGGASTLNFTQAELSQITAGTIVIGEDSTPTRTAGALTVGALAAVSITPALTLSAATIDGGANALTVPTLSLKAVNGIGTTTAPSTVSATISFTNSTSGIVSLTNAKASGLTVSGSNSALGASVTIAETAGPLSTGGAITTTGGGAANISLTAAQLLTVGAVVTAGGSGTVSLTGVGVTNNATVTGTGGITVDAGAGTFINNGAGANLTNGGGAAVTAIGITANDWTLLLASTIAAGAGTLTVARTSDAQINLGGAAANTLTSAELATVSTTGTMYVGSAANTGTIDIGGAVDFGTSIAQATVRATGAGGTITDSTGAAISNTTPGAVTLDAAAGIGSISGGKPVQIGSVSSFSATNSTSGDLYISTTGAVTIGGAGYALSQYSGGSLRVDAGGNLVIAANITAGATGTVSLNATGTITEQSAGAGTVTGATVNLGTASATSVGASGIPILTAATTLLGSSTSSGAIWISNTGVLADVNVNATGGLVDLVNSAAMTLSSGDITSSSSTVTVQTIGLTNNGRTISGPGGVSVNAGTGMLTNGGSITNGGGATATAIGLTADKMALSGGSVGGGAGTVSLLQSTNGVAFNLGSATDAALSTVELSSAELASITTTGTLQIGNANSGTITVSAAVNPSNAPLVDLATGANITGAGALTASGLTASAVSGISMSGANAVTTVSLANSTSGNVSYASSIGAGNTVTVSGSNSVAGGTFTVTDASGNVGVGAAGISTAAGAANISLTAAQLLTVGGAVTAGGSGTVSLTGVGVTNSATVTGTGGITVSAGGGTFTNGAGASLTNGGGAAVTAIGITANDWTLLAASTIVGGAGTVTVARSLDGQIALGGAGLNTLTSAELATVSTTGTMYVGSAANTGIIDIGGAVDFGTGVAQATVRATGAGGKITDSAGTAISNTAAGGNLTLNAAAGIGVLPATPVVVGTVGGTFSATNSTSGNLFVQTTAATTTLGLAGFALSEANNGTLRVDASGGNLVIAGNISVGGATGTVSLNAAGTITEQSAGAGTVTGATVNLGTTSATSVGASGVPILTAATSMLASSSSAGDIWLSNTGTLADVNVNATGGVVDLVNTGAMTVNSGDITSSNSTVTVQTTALLTVGSGRQIASGAASLASITSVGLTNGGTISGPSGVTIANGAGAVTNGGTLQVASGAMQITGSGAVTNNATIQTTTAGTQTYASAVTNNGSGTITGVGLISFDAGVSSTGTVTMGSGSGVTVTGGAGSFTGGTLDFSAGNDTLTLNGAGANLVFGSGLSLANMNQNDSIVFTGAGAQQLNSGTKTLPSVTVNKSGGSVQLLTNNVTQVASAALTFTLTGATTLDLNGLSWTLQSPLDINTDATLAVGSGTLTGAQALTVSGNGVITHGTGTLSGASLTYTSTGASTLGTGVLSISGALTLSGTGSITQTGNNGGNTQSIGTLSQSNGTLSWDSGAVGGTLTVGAGGMALTGGTLGLGNKVITSSGNVAITAGTVNEGNSNVVMNGIATTVEVSGASTQLYDLTIGAAGTVSTAGNVTVAQHLTVNAPSTFSIGAASPVTVAVNGATGTNDVLVNGLLLLDGTTAATTLSVAAGGQINDAVLNGLRVASSANTVTLSSPGPGVATLAGNDIDYNGHTIHLSNISSALATSLSGIGDAVVQDGDVTFSGGLTLSAGSTSWQTGTHTLTTGAVSVSAGTLDASGGGTISAAGNVSFSGAGAFSKGAPSLFVFRRGGAQSLTSGGQDLGNIQVSSSVTAVPTVLSTSDAAHFGSVTIDASNQLSAGTNITVDLNWTNDNTGGNGFLPNGHNVTFTVAVSPVKILGYTKFFGFICTTPGATIEFQGVAAVPPPTPPTGPPNAGIEILPGGGFFQVIGTSGSRITLTTDTLAPVPLQWQFLLDSGSPGATLNMQYVNLQWSYAVVPVPVPNSTITVTNCNNWFTTNPVTSSYTRDINHDGKLDAIEVFCTLPVDNDFSQFQAAVSGYTVTGYSNGPTTASFYIDLAEKPYLDTGLTTTWHIISNTSLEDNATTGKLVVIASPTMPSGGDTATAADGAPPVIAYTLAVAGKSQIFVRFSEPVYATAPGTSLTATDFSITGGNNQTVTSVSPVTSSGNGDTELLLNLSAPLSASDIATTETLNMSAGEDYPTSAPTPPYPSNPANIPAPQTLASATHRITDVGLGPPGAGLVEPVFAWDETLRDPTRGGIGLISQFDGSQFLQPQTITIQANVNPIVGGDPTLLFDSDVASSYLSNGLWLSNFAETSFSGLVPYPNPGDDSIAVTTFPGGQLRNYVIPGTNPKIRNQFELQFFFYYNGLSYGRITNVNSSTWYRNVRPWSIDIKHLIDQRANITILNNIINPDRGEKASLYYTLPNAGLVSIIVFNLSGDIIAILSRGQQPAGDHSTTWDGRNSQGRPVTRGIYFIRVVASGMDEYRKVLVVR